MGTWATSSIVDRYSLLRRKVLFAFWVSHSTNCKFLMRGEVTCHTVDRWIHLGK